MTYLVILTSAILITWSLLNISEEIRQLNRYIEFLENKKDNSSKSELIDELTNSDTNPLNITTSVNTGVITINDSNNSTDADTKENHSEVDASPLIDELKNKPVRDNEQPKARLPKLEKLKNFNGVKAYKKSIPTNKKAWFNISQGDILRVIETGELVTIQAINRRGNRKFYLCLNSAGVQCTYKREQLEKVKN